MNPFIRWWKFNLVGAIGMALQLSALALLNHVLPGHYLLASGIAVELALLHNFLWHIHYTWRDRPQPWPQTLLRFHLSNGFISIAGNLALMHLLHQTHVPLLVANLIAIACCSLANFALGNKWAFAPYVPHLTQPVPLIVTLAASLMMSPPAKAQTSTLPQAPTPQPASAPTYHSSPSVSYIYHVGAFCGAGASYSSAATKPTVGCGVGITFVPLPVFVEVGLMGPQANRSYLSGYISLDTSIPLAPTSSKYLPLVIAGYSRLFETGHAIDYGLALALPRFTKTKDDTSSLRIELRDYWTFANPNQHNVMLRIGWMGVETD